MPEWKECREAESDRGHPQSSQWITFAEAKIFRSCEEGEAIIEKLKAARALDSDYLAILAPRRQQLHQGNALPQPQQR